MSDLLNKASLVMIPSGYKEDVIYSAVPSDGSGDLALTRASNGTRINSAGLVEDCPWNLLTYSEEFNNAAWTKLNSATISANTTTAPNGTTTADTLTFGSLASSQVYSAQGDATNRAHTASIWARSSTGKKFRIKMANSTTGGDDFSSNFTTTSEWQRFEFTTNSALAHIAFINESGGGAGSIEIWGAQLNIGSTAKPYFPTTDRLNVARLTYQNGGGGCPSLLLEKQSTNLLTYSEQFDNAAWTKDRVTVTANAIISPDGTQNADKFVDSLNGSNTYRIYNSLTLSATTYTMTVYAKAAEYSWCYIRIGNSLRAWYNVSTGTVGTVAAGLTAKIENAGNGWYRLTCTIATATAGGGFGLVGLATGDNVETYTPTTGGMGIYVWGAQLEASSYATSYIPTTSASATRVADACYKTGISSLIGQTSGSVFVESYVLNGQDSMCFWIRNSTGGIYGDFITLYTDANRIPTLQVYTGGVNIVYLTGATALSEGYHKFSVGYANNDFVLYVDGVQIGTDTSGTPPTCNELYIDQYIDGGTRNASKRQAVLFKTRLTNAELAQLTA